ncbi:MAG: fibrobacter succinogenes major paralogous domain-containing protein, partial [Flavobacteriales bacterium]
TTPVVNGCTDPAYTEYDALANTDDGSCATLASTCAEVEMDGYTYSVVEIGDQCWFAENLRTTTYADGSAIPEVTDNEAWTDTITGARCDYYNNASNALTYGRLYNWYAVNNGSGLCPSGWHVPTDGEWTALETYLGANGHSGAEGTALKSTSGWNGGGNGTDNFGFSALPGGNRFYLYGNFVNAGNYGSWWSSSPNDGYAWYRSLIYANPDIVRYDVSPRPGFSVRCLRDAE